MEAMGNEGRCVSVITLKPSRASLSSWTKTDSIVGVEWVIILRILSQMTRKSYPRRFPQKACRDGWRSGSCVWAALALQLLSDYSAYFVTSKPKHCEPLVSQIRPYIH